MLRKISLALIFGASLIYAQCGSPSFRLATPPVPQTNQDRMVNGNWSIHNLSGFRVAAATPQTALQLGDGTMTGVRALPQNWANVLQAALRQYRAAPQEESVPLTGGIMTAPLNTPTINNAQVVGVGANTTIQAAIAAAGTTGAVIIPSGYTGADTFRNPNRVPIIDERMFARNPRGYVNALDFGARPDLKEYSGIGSMSLESPILTVTIPIFTAADVGKAIVVGRAGISGGYLHTTIASYISATQIVLAARSSANASGAFVAYGTDNTAAFNALTQASAPTGNYVQYLRIPAGNYMTTGTIYVRGGETLSADDQAQAAIQDFDPNVDDYMIRVGFNSSGAQDPGGPPVVIRNVQFVDPLGGLNAVDILYAGFFFLGDWFDNSGGVGIHLEPGSSYGTIAEDTFDTGVSSAILMNGNSNINIVGNFFFQNTNAGIQLEGVNDDIDIVANDFAGLNDAYGLYGYSGTASRLAINGNVFYGGDPATGNVPKTSGAIDINFSRGALVSSTINGNTFFESRQHSIVLKDSSGRDTIANNIFDHTGLDSVPGTYSDQTIVDSGETPLVISGNQFINSGSYAFTVGSSTTAIGNICINSFYLSGTPSAPAQGCFDFEGVSDTAFFISNNSTPDANHYVVDIVAPSSSKAISWGNSSAYSGGDVIASNATVSSSGERLTVSGTITSTPVRFNTGVIIPGQRAAAGTRYVCIDTKGNLVSSAAPCNGR